MKRPAVLLLCYLLAIVAASWLMALLLAPHLPFPFPKILRRAATVIAALTIWPFAVRVQHRNLRDLGLIWSDVMRRQFWQGLGIGGALFATLLLLLRLAHVINFRAPEPGEWLLLIAFIPAAALIGILEEIFFRGIVLQSLLKDWGVVCAVIVCSLFYAMLHFAKYLHEPLKIWPELTGLFFFGCVLSVAYLRTRLLALPMGLHTSLAYLAKMGRHFIDFLGREPAWVFGNARWLTGVIAWGLLAVAGAIIAAMTRPRPHRPP